MNSSLEARAFAIYDRSLEFDAEAAEAYVQQSCENDAALLREVQKLRTASEQAVRAGFLDEPFPINAGNVAAELEPPVELRKIGHYQLIRELGAGGFGKVYLAEQQSPVKRMVALKVLRGSLCDDTFLRRFEAERQVLALLSHPNVAQIFDAATTKEGNPYFAMEYVPGVPITQYCDKRSLTIEQRLNLFTRVCSAMQHAHQKGIIHRDIKPANILVAEVDETAQPKVIDFGIAKVLDLDFEGYTLNTQAGGLLGSPAYMSPEQVSQSRVAIDTRSDIYALGVLLYELLTGQTPFQFKNKSLVETLNQVLQTDPLPPSALVAKQQLERVAHHRKQSTPATLARTLRKDIDAIVLKALAKNPERRYASAIHFSADIKRYLSHQPVSAAPLNATYRAGKFIRRHRVAVFGALALALTLIVGLAGTASGLIRARQAETAASQAAANAQRTIALMQDFLAAPDPREQGPNLKVVDMVESFEPELAKLVDQPEIHASLLLTYGITYRSMGMQAKALEFARQSASLRQTHLGNLHADTMESRHLAAQLTGELGDHAEAHSLLTQLRADALVVDADSQLVVEIDDSLARALYLSGQYEEARMAYALLVDRRSEQLGIQHPDTLKSMSGLSLAYSSLGDGENATHVAREVFAIRAQSLGKQHPDTLDARSALAYALGEGGKYQEALTLHEQVLQDRVDVLGPHHQSTLASRVNVAWLMSSLGRHEDARDFNEQTLILQQEALGDDHPDLYSTMSNLATNLVALGNTEDAEPLMQKVVAGRTAILGEQHPTTLTAKNDLMVVYARQSRFSEAEALIREVIEARLNGVGENHPGTLTAMNNLTWLLTRRGAHEEAEELGRTVVEKSLTLNGADHPRTLSSQSNLAATLNRNGKHDEALELIKVVHETRERVLGKSHVDTLRASASLAEILFETGALAEAKTLMESAINQLEQALGSEHRRVIEAREILQKWQNGTHSSPT